MPPMRRGDLSQGISKFSSLSITGPASNMATSLPMTLAHVFCKAKCEGRTIEPLKPKEWNKDSNMADVRRVRYEIRTLSQVMS